MELSTRESATLGAPKTGHCSIYLSSLTPLPRSRTVGRPSPAPPSLGAMAQGIARAPTCLGPNGRCPVHGSPAPNFTAPGLSMLCTSQKNHCLGSSGQDSEGLYADRGSCRLAGRALAPMPFMAQTVREALTQHRGVAPEIGISQHNCLGCNELRRPRLKEEALSPYRANAGSAPTAAGRSIPGTLRVPGPEAMAMSRFGGGQLNACGAASGRRIRPSNLTVALHHASMHRCHLVKEHGENARTGRWRRTRRT